MSGFNLSALAVRERAITLFLIIALTLAGIYAFVNLGRAEDPPFTIKTLTVTAVWPGATAEEMQDLVADPFEKRLQELHWYDRVETFTRPGVVQMMLNLKDQTPPSEVQYSIALVGQSHSEGTPTSVVAAHPDPVRPDLARPQARSRGSEPARPASTPSPRRT
jgi:multidrug efflux pump subunit AcrB